MSMLAKYPVEIKEFHMDSLGHMNNATYLALYEEARWELVTERGFGFKEVHETRQGPVILEVHVKFQKEIRLREKITITTELVAYKGKIGQLKQQMLKADGTVASEALFTFGLFDLKNRRLLDPTPAWKKVLGLADK